ncbi:MAG: polysaccharide deacetylase family protein [Planctomycetota bacterium]
MMGKIALKIDVDTRTGMDEGVPRLLELMRSLGVRGTFFLSFGPDNSGRAVFNIFRQRGFLKKMLKTRAPSLYGWRTILSGTLLPARMIAIARPELVLRIEREGHEVGVHAWDHRRWQDELDGLKLDEVRHELVRACEAYESILGRHPHATAAPAWRANAHSLEVQDQLNLLYSSDCRRGSPFYPRIGARVFKTLQIPTNLPCPEELMAEGLADPQGIIGRILRELVLDQTNVYPAHAEVEGAPQYCSMLEQFIRSARKRDFEFVTLNEVATDLIQHGAEIPTRPLASIELSGRAGFVSSAVA